MLTPRLFCLLFAVSSPYVAMPPWVHAKAQALDADPAQVAQWLEEISPEAWEQRLERSPELVSVSLSVMGDALSGADAALSKRVADYLAAGARSRSNRLGRRGGPFADHELQSLLTLMFIRPERFIEEEPFRARVLAMLPEAIGEDAPAELREVLLFSINNVSGVDFESSEAIEWAWRVVRRRSREREVPYQPGELSFVESGVEAIDASVYSLPSSFLGESEASEFLTSIRELAPARRVVALVDLPLRSELQPAADRLGVDLVETFGRGYSAWPRDPFSFTYRSDGSVVVLLRPNDQQGRREDNFLGRELVQGLPDSLDRSWGELHWSRSPVPFHNGQVLFTKDSVWVSLHSLEPHILKILSLRRVPVESFRTREGWLAYLDGVRRATGELASFYGRDVKFVHAFPGKGDEADQFQAIEEIGGGAGFDLDSLVTLLESPDGTVRALVGDLGEGERLLSSAAASDLRSFAETFGLETTDGLVDAQRSQRALGLQTFVDQVSFSLSADGIEVTRLPLFFVPVRLLENRAGFRHEDFLITWNNVVLNRVHGVSRAEGFSNGLPTGDALATRIYRELGYELDLIPPLVRSVILVGGYRCASQHLRAVRGARD